MTITDCPGFHVPHCTHFVMLFRKNVTEKSFINWRVLLLVKIKHVHISDTPCILNIVLIKFENFVECIRIIIIMIDD
jgi:hypothetical protein